MQAEIDQPFLIHLDSFERTCPLCHRGEQKTLTTVDGRTLVKCTHCEVAYVFPCPTEDELKVHFAESMLLNEHDVRRKFETNRKEVLYKVADFIKSKVAGGSILDVGCATGLFLELFSSDRSWRTFGVELSAAAADKARNKGIEVFNGKLRELGLENNAFDVITVLDAFYYFPLPELELREFLRVLKPGGLLVLEFPSATSRIWRTCNPAGRMLSGTQRPLLVSSDHLFYFTATSAATLLQRCGFEVQNLMPLPANRQGNGIRDLVFQIYSSATAFLYRACRSEAFLLPRFLVAATKSGSA